MILPWIALAILYAAYYTRLTRSQMLETLSEDFIRTARAKGLPERTVILKHVFRIFTVLGKTIANSHHLGAIPFVELFLTGCIVLKTAC